MEIQKTTNYHLFKFIDYNRNIDEIHLNKLIDNIKKNNLLSVNPIIISEDYQVLDGQHRLKACQILNIEVFYIILKGVDVKNNNCNYISTFNAVSKTWNTKDFLHSYIKKGVFEYLVVKEVINKYKISPYLVIKLIGTGKAPTRDFKQGMFKLKTDMKKTYEFLNHLMDFRELGLNINKTPFTYAVLLMFKNEDYKPSQMLKQLTNYPYDFIIRARTEDNIRELEKIYNYNKSKRIRFF